jgi:phosphoglycerate dehydrogenase-like enzyme
MDDRATVAVLDAYEEPLRAMLRSEFEGHRVVFAEGASERDRVDAVREAEVALVGWSPLGARVMDAARRLRVIHKLGVGVDKIDLEAARRRGVAVLTASGVNAAAVAEMTVMLVLAVLRDLPWATAELRAGRFQKEALRRRTHQLAGMAVGLLGFGNIGREVARRLQGFDVDLAYHDVRVAPPEAAHGAVPVDLDGLLERSDVLSIHLPLTPQTAMILNRERIARLRRGAVVVNTSRGGLVDEEALLAALRAGALRGAGLDVTAREPLPPEDPLLACDRLIVTPHMAGAVYNNFGNVARRARRNVLSVLRGDPVPAADVVVAPPP